MRRFISKKSLGFIASLMIMTVAFAVPVMAGTVDLKEKGTGNKIGEIRIYDETASGNDKVSVEFDNDIDDSLIRLKVTITGAEYDDDKHMIYLSGTYSDFDPALLRNRMVNCNRELIHTFRPNNPDLGVIGGKILSLDTPLIPQSYVGKIYTFNLDAGSIQILAKDENGEWPIHKDNGKKMYAEDGGRWYYLDNNNEHVSCLPDDAKVANTQTGKISGTLSLNFERKPAESEEKHEEEHEEAPQPKKSEWRPAPEAAKTPAQTAAVQLTTAQANLAALSVIPAASKEVFKSSGMPLNMTSVNTVDSNTTKLISANSDIPYNVTFMFLGKPMVCTIPAGFNYAQFTKADGTMNIHEVLWSVYTGSWKKTNTRARTTRARAR